MQAGSGLIFFISTSTVAFEAHPVELTKSLGLPADTHILHLVVECLVVLGLRLL